MIATCARGIGLVCWFGGEIVVSAVRVLRDVATTGRDATPRVVRLPLRDEAPGHAALLAAMITLTPGTLTLGLAGSGDRALLVHSMYHHDEAAALDSLRDMESRLLRVRWGPEAQRSGARPEHPEAQRSGARPDERPEET